MLCGVREDALESRDAIICSLGRWREKTAASKQAVSCVGSAPPARDLLASPLLPHGLSFLHRPHAMHHQAAQTTRPRQAHNFINQIGLSRRNSMSFRNWITFALVNIVSIHAVESNAELVLGDWCGTVATGEWLAADYTRASSAKRQVAKPPSITVDTYFHIVTNSTRVQDGWLTVSHLEAYLTLR